MGSSSAKPEPFANEIKTSLLELQTKIDNLNIESQIYETIMTYYDQGDKIKRRSICKSSFNHHLKRLEFKNTIRRNNLAVITVLYLFNEQCNREMSELIMQLDFIMDFCESQGFMKEKIEKICKEIEQRFLKKM